MVPPIVPYRLTCPDGRTKSPKTVTISKVFSFVRILFSAYRFWSKGAWRINYVGYFLYMIKTRMVIFQGKQICQKKILGSSINHVVTFLGIFDPPLPFMVTFTK